MRTAPSPGGHGGPFGVCCDDLARIWHGVEENASDLRKHPRLDSNQPDYGTAAVFVGRHTANLRPRCAHLIPCNELCNTDVAWRCIGMRIPMEVDRACNADKRP